MFDKDDVSIGIKNSLNFYIEKCEKSGLKNVRERVNEMLTIDYLVGNYDRHWKNFSILRNAKTLEIIDLAPIYDNDRSFSYTSDSDYMVSGFMVDNLKYVIEENKITKLSKEKFEEKINLLKDVDTKDVYDINKYCDEIIRRFCILQEEIKNRG